MTMLLVVLGLWGIGYLLFRSGDARASLVGGILLIVGFLLLGAVPWN